MRPACVSARSSQRHISVDPAVSNLSHARRAIRAAMRFTSSARSERFASSRSFLLPLNVLVSTASHPTAKKTARESPGSGQAG